MTDPAPFLEIKNWKKHQHYKQERPAWIKVYGALLDDPAFLALPETAQAQLLKLWLLASRMGHPLPNDAELLASKICTKRLYLAALTAAGFLIPTHEKSRESLEDSYSTKTDNNREQRTETETKSVVGGGGVTGVVIGTTADYALQVTIAANSAITRRWGEQAHPLLHGHSYDLTDHLEAAGVPLEMARDSIALQCERSQKPTPPKSINWFKDGVLQAFAETQQRAAQVAVGDTGRRFPSRPTKGKPQAFEYPNPTNSEKDVKWQ